MPVKQLNNVMEVVQQQAIMLDEQAGIFERMVGDGTLSTTSELMLSTEYWQALGTSFVDMVRAARVCTSQRRTDIVDAMRVLGRKWASGRVGRRCAHVGRDYRSSWCGHDAC